MKVIYVPKVIEMYANDDKLVAKLSANGNVDWTRIKPRAITKQKRQTNITNLTPGKIYDVINSFISSEGGEVYLIFDNKGGSHWFNDDILIPIEKYREDKLNQLGI
jgi:hypothetical protein